jgi:hypothetical protein
MKKWALTFALLICGSQPLFAQEIDLSDYHTCWGTVIDDSKYSLSYVAPTRSECSNGTVTVAYEKLIDRINNKAVFSIKDTLNIPINCPDNCPYLTRCTDKKGLTQVYFLLVDGRAITEEYFSDFKQAWTYQSDSTLVEVSTRQLSCVNEDYGAG